jgi:transcriptional regulator with XRE-family HTH domain
MKRRKRLRLALGKALRRFREEAGLTQEGLAFASGVHPTYVSQLERGLKSPSLDVIATLAAALKQKAYVLIRAAEEEED